MLPDAPRHTFGARLQRALLGLDSAIDSGLWSLGQRSLDGWTRFRVFMDRFHVSGLRRAAVDLSCEALTLGAAGGVAMLALATPAFRETSDDFMRRQELAVTFLDRYGNEAGKRGIKHDDSVPLEEFPDYLVKAALATEDRRFYEHWGIDPIGTIRALSANSRAGGVVQGGSSITQQLAKNLFLNNERSIERKIKEAFLAIWLETRLTKDQILKLYLDRAYMGGGAFGAGAAADFYFGKSVKDLTLAESAMLAGLFKAPTKFAPHVNLPAARARANVVLSNMVEAGFLTEGQVLAARRNPAAPVDRKRETTADYYLDWAFDQIRKMAEEGKLGSDRVLTVKTPLDPGIQRHAEQALENSLRQYGAQYDVTQGAIVVMDLDGATRAIVGGRDYGASQFNRATDALRQPGSSFKPFVYATAMSDPLTAAKYKPDSIVRDAPVCIGDWCPKNYSGGFAGAMPLTVALAKSYNTIPVWMSLDLSPRGAKGERTYRMGRAKIIDMARAMGLTTDIKDTPSLPIGAVDVTVMDMTSGYSTIANGGRRSQPYAAIDIRNSNGDLIWRHGRDAAPPKQVLSPQVDGDLVYMMTKVVEEGTARRAMLPGIKVAGKTGTTNAYRDAWFIGFTGNYVAGVWMGNDDNSSMATLTGGVVPALTWHEVMAYAHERIDLKPIPLLTRDAAPPPAPVAARAPKNGADDDQPAQRPSILSRPSLDALAGIERQFKQAAQTPSREALGSDPSRRDSPLESKRSALEPREQPAAPRLASTSAPAGGEATSSP